MKENKIYQPQQIIVRRSEINFAAYNPRIMDESARKKLKKNMQTVGLLGGIVWNKTTGNLVSGHQRVAIMDSVNRYNAETHENDYEFRVEAVELDEKTEKEQNLFMNNRAVQGTYDDDLLRRMLQEIDFELAGFEELDLQMLGIADVGINDADANAIFAVEPSAGGSALFSPNESSTKETDDKSGSEDSPADDLYVPFGGSIPANAETKQNWNKGEAIAGDERLKAVDEYSTTNGEDTKIDRKVNFYNDSAENQIARHNEVSKIRERINSQNDLNKDGGMLSYVVVSFSSPYEKADFLESYGFDPTAKYIDGEKLQDAIEFGVE